MGNIRNFRELRVYEAAMEAGMKIFEWTKKFPVEEKYSMVDQVRKSSRSVCTNLAEAWRKRRYPAHFSSKLTDAESEAEETRVWMEFAWRCGYIAKEKFEAMDGEYDKILGQLVRMAAEPEQWTIR